MSLLLDDSTDSTFADINNRRKLSEEMRTKTNPYRYPFQEKKLNILRIEVRKYSSTSQYGFGGLNVSI